MGEIVLCIICKRYPVEHNSNKCESCNKCIKHSVENMKIERPYLFRSEKKQEKIKLNNETK